MLGVLNGFYRVEGIAQQVMQMLFPTIGLCKIEVTENRLFLFTMEDGQIGKCGFIYLHRKVKSEKSKVKVKPSAEICNLPSAICNFPISQFPNP
jgi:hypothetical protein